MTSPFIPPWMVQWYAYVPAVGNVREAEPFEVVAILPPVTAAALSNVTLCPTLAKFHVTWPLAVMVTLEGSNVFEVVALTFALEPGVDTVTVTVCDFVTLPIVPSTAIVV